MKASQKQIDKTLIFFTKRGYAKFDKEFLKTTKKFLRDLLQIDYVLINKFNLNNLN
jgi:hypothetical protein